MESVTAVRYVKSEILPGALQARTGERSAENRPLKQPCSHLTAATSSFF